MAFNSFNEDMDIISKLGDEPNEDDGLSADALKAKFDLAGKKIKTFLNNLISAMAGENGAANIGFESSENVPADNVQDAIENVQEQLVGVSQGAVADGSITTAKLNGGAVTTAKLDDGAVTTAKLDDGAVTGDKLADDVFEWVNLVETGVLQYNRLQPTTQTDYDSNALDFYYCEKLGLMYVAGWVEFVLTDDHMARALFTLPKSRKGFSHVAFASELKVNMGHSATMYESVDIDTSTTLRVFVEGASQSEVGKTATVYLSGIYLCEVT